MHGNFHPFSPFAMSETGRPEDIPVETSPAVSVETVNPTETPTGNHIFPIKVSARELLSGVSGNPLRPPANLPSVASASMASLSAKKIPLRGLRLTPSPECECTLTCEAANGTVLTEEHRAQIARDVSYNLTMHARTDYEHGIDRSKPPVPQNRIARIENMGMVQ